MACFLVPTAEAVVTTVVEKATGKKVKENAEKHPFLSRMNWLNNMLWGGSALLAFEHVWHGEVVPWFPFLTAASEGGEAVSEMLHEMMTSGVAMAAVVTVVWAGMALTAHTLKKKDVSFKLRGGKA